MLSVVRKGQDVFIWKSIFPEFIFSGTLFKVYNKLLSFLRNLKQHKNIMNSGNLEIYL
jgi:hypothetical protein